MNNQLVQPNQQCEDCEEYKNDVDNVEIEGFDYKLCKDCLAERDFNDEWDGVDSEDE